MTLDTFNQLTDVFTPLLWKPPGCRGDGFPVQRTKAYGWRRYFKGYVTVRRAGGAVIHVPVDQIHFRPGAGPAPRSRRASAFHERLAILDARAKAGMPPDLSPGSPALPWKARTPLDRLVVEKAERIWQQAASFAPQYFRHMDLPAPASGWDTQRVAEILDARQVETLDSGDSAGLAVLKIHPSPPGWTTRSNCVPAPAYLRGTPLYLLLWSFDPTTAKVLTLLPETARRLAVRSHRDGFIARQGSPSSGYDQAQRVRGGRILCNRCQAEIPLANVFRAFKEDHGQYKCRCCECVVFSEWTFKVLRRERG